MYCIWSGPSFPRPGVLRVQILYKNTHAHTQHTQVCFPAQEIKGEGRGPCRRLGPAAQASASGMYIAVSPLILRVGPVTCFCLLW